MCVCVCVCVSVSVSVCVSARGGWAGWSVCGRGYRASQGGKSSCASAFTSSSGGSTLLTDDKPTHTPVRRLRLLTFQ